MLKLLKLINKFWTKLFKYLKLKKLESLNEYFIFVTYSYSFKWENIIQMKIKIILLLTTEKKLIILLLMKTYNIIIHCAYVLYIFISNI